ncbi:hypothetical protein MKX01_008835 [Papaver californicum]|nr:hypothetical protein MKX01_008835 [Papaver californicum]
MKRKTVFPFLFLYLLFLLSVYIEVAAKNLRHGLTPQDYESNKNITTHMRRGGGGGHGGRGRHGGRGSRGGSSSRGGGRNRGTGSSSTIVPRGGIYPYPYYGSTSNGKHNNNSSSCGGIMINHHKGAAFTIIVALTALKYLNC